MHDKCESSAVRPVLGVKRPWATAVWNEHPALFMIRTVRVGRSSLTPARLAITTMCRTIPYSTATAAPSRLANDNGKRRGASGAPGTAVITKTKLQTKRPSLYRVLLLNDDYTPMEFVVVVLERFFHKDPESALRIMMRVHHHGIGECGTYTYEVAETKVTQVMDFARKHQHPLQCVMEKK
jgi:ATP-dependent Clp protease adaptor protein ClpS